MATGKQFGGKLRDKIEEEASREAVSFYRGWRQKTKNGILPVGIANVGKTTFLQRFEVAEPNLFLDFNRTLGINSDTVRLREDFARIANGIEFYKKIDVPGDLPDLWAMAYFDNSPRVLVILVDDRDTLTHITQLRKFLGFIEEGPTVWQKAKTLVNLRWNNLSRILFVVNKADQFESERLTSVADSYRSVLSDIQSTLQVPVQLFRVSLASNCKECNVLFRSVIDGLCRK